MIAPDREPSSASNGSQQHCVDAYVGAGGFRRSARTERHLGATMRRFTILLFVGVLAVAVGCSATVSTSAQPAGPTSVSSAVRQLDPVDFAAQLPSRMTINVHIPDEGSLPDTDLALPYDQIGTRQRELPADRSTKIAIYCMTGTMSADAGQTLSELGYTDVIELRGGMAAWRAAGLPFLPAN